MSESGKLTVKTSILSESNQIDVNITDTGPGLDKIAREKLFEPFFTTKKKGTGLGLAISKRLIEQHDGEIVANNNTIKGGASFSVYLPLDSVE